MHPRLVALAGSLAFGLISAPLAAQDADTVVATVGESEITVGHMIVARQTLPRQYQQLPDEVLFEGLLDQLIQQNALAQSVANPTPATRLTIENQRTGLLAGEAIGQVGEAAVTDEAIRAAYAERFAEAEPSTEFNASHILVQTEEEARALVEQLGEGADFAELAREHSTGPSGPDGGALGWFSSGMMVPEFEQAVTSLEPGEVSEPVQTQFGWHVVRLNETRLSDAPPLEQVRDEIVQQIREDAVQAHIDSVVEAADVSRAAVEVDPSILSDMSLVAE